MARDPATVFKTWTWETKKSHETGISLTIFDPQGKEFAKQVMEAAKKQPPESPIAQVARQMELLYGDISKLRRESA
jgi:hypothetical protein